MTKSKISKKDKLIAYWLLLGVFMIVIQIALGGLTRLTGSGLSMTEWEPIMGFLPPLNDKDWQSAFESYQNIAQYKYINNHFTLSDFKFIFYWEWFHRNWARFIAVVFLVPFVYFLARKYFNREMKISLFILFLLGALQGFIGWYMVKSGLDDSSLFYVSHLRLAVHLISALGLLVYTLWFALKIIVPGSEIQYNQAKTRNFFFVLITIFTLQLVYGAFMAGLRAASAAPSWPKMNGHWIPVKLMDYSWVYHPIGVQFVHRGLAYILLILTLIGFYKIWKISRSSKSKLLSKVNFWLLFLILIQIGLGIFTVISAHHIEKGKFGIFETLAQLHQIVAMFLLVAMIIALFLVRGRNKNVNQA